MNSNQLSVRQMLLRMLLALGLLMPMASAAWAEDDEFVPAYQNEGNWDIEEPGHFMVRHQGRNYYTSGKKNGFRVFENNEESTDETIGILTFLLAPATIVYMNLEGFWN